MGGGAWRRKLSGTVTPTVTLKFQPKQTPLGWLALAGGNEEAAGRGQFWRDTHEIKSCVPPEVTRSSSTPALHTL